MLELINHFRNVLVAKATSDPFELIDLPQEAIKDLQKVSQKLSVEELLYIIYTLIGAYNIIKRLDVGKILLEVTLLKLAIMPSPVPFDKLMEKVEEATKNLKDNNETKTAKAHTQTSPKDIISKDSIGFAKPDMPSDGIKEKNSKTTNGKDSDTKYKSFGLSKDFLNTLNNFSAKSTETEENPVSAKETTEEIQAGYDLPKILTIWPVFLNKMRNTKVSLASFLEYAQPIKVDGRVLTIAFDSMDNFHREVAEQTPNVNLIKKVFCDILKTNFKIDFVNIDLPNKKTSDQYFQDNAEEEVDLSELNKTLEDSNVPADTDSEPGNKNSDNEIVKKAINLFKGKIINGNN